MVRRSLGHGSIRGISPQMGLQARVKKKEEKGVWMLKQESRNIEMQTDTFKERHHYIFIRGRVERKRWGLF